MLQAIIHYFRAWRFFRRGWMWKYNFLALLNLIWVVLLTICIFVGIVIAIMPWCQQFQLSPLLHKLVSMFIKGLSNTYHIRLPSQPPFVTFVQIMGFFFGILFGLGLQEIINQPIYRKISLHVEKAVSKNFVIAQSNSYGSQIGHNIKTALWKGPLYLLGLFVLVAISFIPYVGVVAFFLVTSYGLGMYYIGYGLERCQLSPKTRSIQCRKNFWCILLFGCLCCVALFVFSMQLYLMPFLCLIVHPLQVSAGTTLSLRCIRRPVSR